MNSEEFCDCEPLTPMERAWKYRGDFEEKIARDELLTLSDISSEYGISRTEILLSPEFPAYYLSRTGVWWFPKKEVEAFFKKNKTGRTNDNE
ncbi:MAG: hypothetical protein LBJ96_00385 [Holosporaceae bacterium]|jgi:hypothetical protein|nr:hypothetical protein [Holosporaceae bacterium]